MSKTAPALLLEIDDNFRLDTDGDKNVILMTRQEVDKSHHKATKGTETHRWVVNGYYPTILSAGKAALNKMVVYYGYEKSDGSLEKLIALIESCRDKIVAACESAS